MLLSSPPSDFPVHDTYFVVAHFHYGEAAGLTAGLAAGLVAVTVGFAR